jgi:predicted TIM-barrel fold metal-dependent hydrolase
LPTCEGEEPTLPLMIECFGAECILYASDYPHWDTGSSNTVRHIVERKYISQESKEKILTSNARVFYGAL